MIRSVRVSRQVTKKQFGRQGRHVLGEMVRGCLPPLRGSAEPRAPFFLFSTQFIGVFGNPANKAAGGDAGESIAMTAPVVTGSPSLDKGERRKLFLPRYLFSAVLGWMLVSTLSSCVLAMAPRGCRGGGSWRRSGSLSAFGVILRRRGKLRVKNPRCALLPGLFVFRRVHPVYCTGTYLWHLAWNRALGLGSLSSLSIVRLWLWKLGCLSVAGASRSRRPPAHPIRSAFCLLLSGSKISMTAPVVVMPGSDSTMQFIMPRQFKKIRWVVRRFWFEI